MRVRTHVHTLHKAGNAAAEYEDAYDYGWSPEAGAPAFRCAVADGATEASFSALWAAQLVRAYCSGGISVAALAGSLPNLQQQWLAQVSAAAADAPEQWYVTEKLRRGAFSSLVGLTLQPGVATDGHRDGAAGRWHALAVGDSCLFQVRGDELIVRFPLACADEFTNRPFLLSSNAAGNAALDQNIYRSAGAWEAGDRFYLMTDALAHWFLISHEQRARPWQMLARLDTGAGDGAAFTAFISAARGAQALRNDDVTVVSVTTEI